MRWKQVGAVLLLGQLFALLSALSGVFAKQLAALGLATPVLNTLLAYALLLLFFLVSRDRSAPGWSYPVSSLFDTAAFVSSVFAFARSPIASVTMILFLSVLVTALLSRLCFRTRYSCLHALALLLCLLGVLLTVSTDLRDTAGHFSLGSLDGDLFAFCSALCYGATSVLSDFQLRRGTNNFALTAFLGLFGLLYTAPLFLLHQEYELLPAVPSHPSSLLLYLAYALTGAGIYGSAQLLIRLAGATIFRVVGLSATLYAMIFDSLLFGSPFKLEYILGYILIIGGVLIFSLKDPEYRQ